MSRSTVFPQLLEHCPLFELGFAVERLFGVVVLVLFCGVSCCCCCCCCCCCFRGGVVSWLVAFVLFVGGEEGGA